MRYVKESEPVDRVEALRKLLAAQDITAAELGRMLGRTALGGRILRGECPLRDQHLERLGRHFCVAPELVLKLVA
jgi:hypothetical protein